MVLHIKHRIISKCKVLILAFARDTIWYMLMQLLINNSCNQHLTKDIQKGSSYHVYTCTSLLVNDGQLIFFLPNSSKIYLNIFFLANRERIRQGGKQKCLTCFSTRQDHIHWAIRSNIKIYQHSFRQWCTYLLLFTSLIIQYLFIIVYFVDNLSDILFLPNRVIGRRASKKDVNLKSFQNCILHLYFKTIV